MMLSESNMIQKLKEERGKEILKVGGSVTFANTAQKRMEFGNGLRRTRTSTFLEAAAGGFRRGVGGNGGQGILVPSEGPGGEGAAVPAPLPDSRCRQSGMPRALPGAARGCREAAGVPLPTAQLCADRRGSREMSPCCCCRSGAAHAHRVRRGPAPQAGAQRGCPTHGSRAPPGTVTPSAVAHARHARGVGQWPQPRPGQLGLPLWGRGHGEGCCRHGDEWGTGKSRRGGKKVPSPKAAAECAETPF